MRLNRLWLTQIYLDQVYIPELIQLANDKEVNPGPEISTGRVNLEDSKKMNYFFLLNLEMLNVRLFGVSL